MNNFSDKVVNQVILFGCSLKQLEELVVSNNRIQAIPNSIGQLENLRIFLTDVNALVRLPATIGHCRSLRILNVASNNLLNLPDEIGNLKELRVLNLANNYLRYLPVAAAQLPNLTALWLNDNQKKPLMALQTDHDEKSNSQVLTCFLFPQTGPIFGPVSPAVAAAVMAAASYRPSTSTKGEPSQQQQQQQQDGYKIQPTAGVITADDKSPPNAIYPHQLPAAQANINGLLRQIAPSSTAHHHRHLAGSKLLDEDEDERADLLQMSNTLNKSYAPIKDDSGLLNIANKQLDNITANQESSQMGTSQLVMLDTKTVYLQH